MGLEGTETKVLKNVRKYVIQLTNVNLFIMKTTKTMFSLVLVRYLTVCSPEMSPKENLRKYLRCIKSAVSNLNSNILL